VEQANIVLRKESEREREREQMRDQSAGHLAKVESEVASESVCSLVPIVWPLMGAIYERVANLWSGQLELGPRAKRRRRAIDPLPQDQPTDGPCSVRPKAFRKRVVCFSYKIATINSYKHARRALFYCRLKSHFGSIKIGSLGVRK
jgi:hypothetical protein